MTEVENAMCEATRWAMQKGVESYLEVDRPDWVLESPGQIVLNGSWVHWTAEVEPALEKDDVKKYLDKCNEQLMELVMLARGKVTKMQRTTIGALVVTMSMPRMWWTTWQCIKRIKCKLFNNLLEFH